MPCDSSYMNPTDKEQQSTQACRLLLYALRSLNRSVPGWVLEGARSLYGDTDKLDKQVAFLCETIKSMSEDELNRVVYNGRSAKARLLADWWEVHLAADKAREKREAEKARRSAIREQLRSKLTDEELEVAGISKKAKERE